MAWQMPFVQNASASTIGTLLTVMPRSDDRTTIPVPRLDLTAVPVQREGHHANRTGEGRMEMTWA